MATNNDVAPATLQEQLAKAEKDLQLSDERLRAAPAPNNKESPTAKHQQELRDELASIRKTQQSNKSGRAQTLEKIKRLDETFKTRKDARSKLPVQSLEALESKMQGLQKQVDSGMMKLADERKALDEISTLKRQKRSLATLEEGISEVKAELARLRKSLDDPASKAQSDRYEQISAELDKIKAEQDESYKQLSSLREDRRAKLAVVKDLRDQYYNARRAAQEAKRAREEKRRAENAAFQRAKRQEAAKLRLEEASTPAYQEEMRTAQNLIAFFDPSSAQKQEATGPGKFAATATRTVEGPDMNGVKLAKKGEEESYFIGGGGGKKKGKKNRPANSAAVPFSLDFGTISSFGTIGVDPPMSQSEVPSVVEKLKAKIEHWKTDSQRKTDEVSHQSVGPAL